MPNAIAVRREVLKTDKYLFRDEFWGNIVNQYRWTVTDTESKITVSGGNLVFAGGMAAPGWGDPKLLSAESFRTVAGLAIRFEINTSAGNYCGLGLDKTPAVGGENWAHGIELGSSFFFVTTATHAPLATPLAVNAGTSYVGLIVVGASITNYYVSSDGGSTYKIIGSETTTAATTLQAVIDNYDRAFTDAYVSVFHSIPKQPLLSDTFTRDDSALTLGNAETGQAWTAVAGTWGISSNKAYSASDGQADIAAIDAGRANWILDCVVNGTLSGAAYSLPEILTGYIDTGNFLRYFFFGGSVYLQKRDSGVNTVLASAATTTNDNTDYSIRIVKLDNAISVYVDGVAKIAYTLAGGDTKYSTPTVICLCLENAGAPGTIARWDSLKIQGGLP